ncbi:MAG: response regulator [bacterium]
MKELQTKILVVDDDALLRDLLVDTLQTIGYETTGVSDGIEALQSLRNEKYDLMISDIKMPGIDGLALLRKTRRLYPDLPVLFITGVASPEIIGRALPDGFLAKPFRINHIEEMIEDTLRLRTQPDTSSVKRVLIVDDDDLFRDMLTEALRLDGYIPCSASGGEQALREMENGEVDAVITDIRMPGMDGITLLKKLKGQRPGLPVILMTAFFSVEEVRRRSQPAEADGFLQKPFEIDNIFRVLKEINRTPATF